MPFTFSRGWSLTLGLGLAAFWLCGSLTTQDARANPQAAKEQGGAPALRSELDEAVVRAARDKALEEIRKEVATKEAVEAAQTAGQSSGDTAWMLISSALVMFMVPGLALFYGGMVRRKNVLATMMESMACLAVIGVYWVAVGYALAFGPSLLRVSLLGVQNGGLIGWSWDLFFLHNVSPDQVLPGTKIPVYVHVMFQGMFAIITPALISGSVAERIRFWPFCLFTLLWVTFVYCPLAHMVWAYDWFTEVPLDPSKGAGASPIGLLGKLGALDFAGGTVVHIAAGMAGLATCLVLRQRAGYPKIAFHPNSMVLTLLGAGLLWFGWFGFNGGSAISSSPLAGSAFAATQAAAAMAGLGWMIVERLHKGKSTALGLASGIVAGLVAVTPASGYVYVWSGLIIGLVASLICYFAVTVKSVFGYDDSLDAFGVHAVGGFVGAVLTGIFCSTAVNPAGADGPLAIRAQQERLKMLESKLIPLAKSQASTASQKVETLVAQWKSLQGQPDRQAEVTELATRAIPETQKVADEAAKKVDTLEAEWKKLKEADQKRTQEGKGLFSQFGIQFQAAVFAAAFAFVGSLVLALATQAVTRGNFTTTLQEEAEGLDRTEHGEVGFDFGYATEDIPTTEIEPRPANVPKGEGVSAEELRTHWSALCQPTDRAPDPDFLAVYPYITTLSGTAFRGRGRDPSAVAAHLEKLLKKRLPDKPLKVTPV
jgi:ammonium transporter